MEGAPKHPAIITPIGGGTYRSAPLEQFVLPDPNYLLPEYPRDLFPITRVILREAAEKFKEGKRLVPSCSYVIERLTPFFVSAVENRLIRSHEVSECIRVLVRLTLIASDCRDWYSLSQQVEASEQWGKLDQAIAEATMPALKEAGLVPEKRHTSEQPTADSNYYLGEWINEMVDEGRKVAGMLRANKRIEDIRLEHPVFCTEVLDALPQRDRDLFCNDARRSLTIPLLLHHIGQVKGIGEERASDLRKKYRRAVKKTRQKK